MKKSGNMLFFVVVVVVVVVCRACVPYLTIGHLKLIKL